MFIRLTFTSDDFVIVNSERIETIIRNPELPETLVRLPGENNTLPVKETPEEIMAMLPSTVAGFLAGKRK